MRKAAAGEAGDTSNNLFRRGSGEDFPNIETYGLARLLGDLAHALKKERYQASPGNRVNFAKANGYTNELLASKSVHAR